MDLILGANKSISPTIHPELRSPDFSNAVGGFFGYTASGVHRDINSVLEKHGASLPINNGGYCTRPKKVMPVSRDTHGSVRKPLSRQAEPLGLQSRL